MALYLQTLYEDAVRQFGTTVTDTRFAADFVSAANRSLDQLSRCADLTTDIAHVEATDASVSSLDEGHSDIMASGITYYLMVKGHGVTSREGPRMLDRAKALWEECKGDWMIEKSREDQAAEDSDGNPTGDIIGLGYMDE